MKLLKIAALSAAVLSGGCATEMAWQRYDGRPLDRSFASTAEHCRDRARHHWGERAEAMERCMRRHGYVWTTVVVSDRYDGYNGYDDYNGYDRHRHRHRHHDDYED
jgi:hypothetical protein